MANILGARRVIRVSRTAKEDCITYEEAYKNFADAEVIINTTPCGMYPNIIGEAINLDGFPKIEAVVDAIYNPLSSNLVIKAKDKGINATGGLYMLVSQAIFAVEKFMDKECPQEKAQGIFKDIYKSKENIVL